MVRADGIAERSAPRHGRLARRPRYFPARSARPSGQARSLPGVVDQRADDEADDPRLQAEHRPGPGRRSPNCCRRRWRIGRDCRRRRCPTRRSRNRRPSCRPRRGQRAKKPAKLRPRKQRNRSRSPRRAAGKFPDLSKTLDAIIAKAAEPGRKFKTIKPPAWATNPEPMPWAEERGSPAAGTEPRQEAAGDPALQWPLRSEDERGAAGQGRRHQRPRQSDWANCPVG